MTNDEKILAFNAIQKYNTAQLLDFAEWRDKVQAQGDGSSRALPDGAEQRCDVHMTIDRLIRETKVSEDKQRLIDHVQSIADNLSDGMTYEECGMDHEEAGAEPSDTVSGHDWLNDVLDIQYVINSDKTFRSAKVLVAFGGPNIWVCFDDMKVKGYWWGDYAEASFTDSMEVESALEELYDC